MSIREGGKIKSNNNSLPIKDLWNEWRQEMKVYVHLYSFKIWSVGGSRTFRQGGPSNVVFYSTEGRTLEGGPYQYF